MAKLLPGGFPEWLPKEQLIENRFKEIISLEFQKYGFVNIETPAIERTDILTAKSGADASQQIYGLHGLAQVQKGQEDYKDYSLHFDLTVPMSRYVLDHASELAFPFKRFQIQKVWRGESSQKGRYREFYQCDVDVIDKKVDPYYDAETIEVLSKTLQKAFNRFGINKSFTVQLNNRKIYDAIFSTLELQQDIIPKIMKIIDDYYKIGQDKFNERLELLIGIEKSRQIQYYLNYSLENLDNDDPVPIQEAKKELKNIYKLLSIKGIKVDINPYIVRGLDYYTGTVFETFIDDYPEFGSVCSGGRYDNLSKHITDVTGTKGENYEGVGGSIGLSRLLGRLLDAGLIHNHERLVDVMFFNISGQAIKYKEEIAAILREDGIKVDIYYKNDKLDRQFKYADKQEIPLGIFIGETEEKEGIVKIKNLITKDNYIVNKNEIIIKTKNELDKLF